MRKTISKKTRFEVFKRDSFRCQYCGGSAPDVVLHVDHVTPVSGGGANDIMNLVTSCAQCNAGKGARRLDDRGTLENQREMPMLGEARRPTLAPWELVKACKHELAAVHLCIQLSGFTDEVVAERLGIDKGHMSRIMRGRAHFPSRKITALMDLCGNYAPLQYLSWACGFDLQERSKDVRIRELEAELERVRGAA